MFRLSRTAFKNIRPTSRKISSVSEIPNLIQKTIWGKSNMMYITYVLVGALAVELIYGTATNYIWETVNKGVSTIYSVNLVIFLYIFIHIFILF